ncbi:hypothetical protein HYV49_02955 [Candidatus Pacearchaeota archaeon]|nr:hypothetical protein [Candidatus Pacearchaeota archaeon]
MLTKKIIYIIIFSFIFNLAWEIFHSPLYKTAVNALKTGYYPILILKAAGGDIIMVLIIFLAISSFNRSFQWEISNKKNITLSIIFGLIISIGFELYAQYTDRFFYNSKMPIIPFIKVGLTPVLQMIITPLITFWFAEKIN